MIKNNLWESLVWIIIWVFILSFIILWVSNLLINSKKIIEDYDNIKTINILVNNTNNILTKLDTSILQENDYFYLYKDKTYKNFLIFTWTINESYKYINKYWDHIENIDLYNWDIYSRILSVEKENDYKWKNNQILKTDIKKIIK